MQRMQLNIAEFQSFSAFLSAAAAGCLFFYILRQMWEKVLPVLKDF